MTEQYLSTNINDPRIVRIENADYQITLDDSIIAASAPVAAITLTLPEARTIPGWTVCVKAQDVTGGSITVVGLNGQLIDGAVSTVLSAALDSVVLESIGDEWVICGGGPGPLTVTPVAGDTVNGGLAPFAVPAAGLTLVSDGSSNWETFG